MKKIIFLFAITMMSLVACQKSEENIAAKNMTEALGRLSAVKIWKVDKITRDGVLKYENGTYFDDTFDGVAETLAFNTASKTITVTYPDGEVSIFEYEINNDTQTFTVKDEDDTEVMTIKSGSVFSDKFELESTYGVTNNGVETMVTDVITLVPKD